LGWGLGSSGPVGADAPRLNLVERVLDDKPARDVVDEIIRDCDPALGVSMLHLVA
jgi:hypothetical protein